MVSKQHFFKQCKPQFDYFNCLESSVKATGNSKMFFFTHLKDSYHETLWLRGKNKKIKTRGVLFVSTSSELIWSKGGARCSFSASWPQSFPEISQVKGIRQKAERGRRAASGCFCFGAERHPHGRMPRDEGISAVRHIFALTAAPPKFVMTFSDVSQSSVGHFLASLPRIQFVCLFFFVI